MERTQLSGCAIIEGEKLLLIYKRIHRHYEFPGGRVKTGETLEEAAIRETKEELGVDVDLIKYLGFKEFHIRGEDFRSHKYLARIRRGQTPKVIEAEISRDLLWMPMRKYTLFLVAPNVRQFCEDYIAGRLDLS